jgi:hypothetical protein
MSDPAAVGPAGAPSPAPAAPAATRPVPRRRFKAFLARLVLLAIVGVICLAALEILIRIFMPYYNPRYQVMVRRDEHGVVLGIPNLHTIQGSPKGEFVMDVAFNRHGLRDPKDFVSASTNDLFAVGDSFTMGWGITEAERYSNLLEKSLGRPVYNVAIPEDIRGYQRLVQFVERNGVKPRHMILGLCMENDLWDYTAAESNLLLFEKQMHRTPLHRLARWCKSRSALWTALSHTLQRYPVFRRAFESIGIARNVDELTHKNDSSPQVLASTRDELLKLATNYHSVVLVIPSRALWAGQDADREKEKQIHDQLLGQLRAAGVTLVDMKPIFEKEAGDPLSFYFKLDPHWNPHGHALAARALHDTLQQTPGWEFLKTPGTAPPATQ